MGKTSSAAKGPVAATVDGEPIALSEVRALAGAGLSPKTALARLEAEILLAKYAEERGYGELAPVQRDVTRARARALLETEVEAEVASLPEAAVRERFEQLRAKLDKPETRRITRLKIALPQGGSAFAARAAAQQLFARLAAIDSNDDVLDAMRAAAVPDPLASVRITREDVTLRRGPKTEEQPLDRAVFAAGAPGLIPEIVETATDVQVVLLTEIAPAEQAQLADHEQAIREQMLKEARAKRLDALLAELERGTKVAYDEQAIERAFADDGVLGVTP